MAAGRVYDVDENKKMTDFLNQQSQYLADIEKEGTSKTAVRYAIIIGGCAIMVLGLKYFLSKNKK